MNKKHRRTLDAIFTDLVPADIRWVDIEGLIRALGADVREGRGSRVRVTLNDCRATFHRPKPETGKGAVRSAGRFLETAGVKP